MEALVNPYCNKKAHGAVSVSPFFSSKFLREIYQISISKRKANTLQYVFMFLLFSLFMPYIVVFNSSVQNYALFPTLANYFLYLAKNVCLCFMPALLHLTSSKLLHLGKIRKLLLLSTSVTFTPWALLHFGHIKINFAMSLNFRNFAP